MIISQVYDNLYVTNTDLGWEIESEAPIESESPMSMYYWTLIVKMMVDDWLFLNKRCCVLCKRYNFEILTKVDTP